MSDTRFTMLGIGLIFAGFVVMGILGGQYFDATIQAEEFETCLDYSGETPVPVECDAHLQGKTVFFGLVIGLIGAGIISLVKGVRGRWDQDVKPEDIVGPGSTSSDKPE